MSTLFQDFRQGFRALCAKPLYTTVVLSLLTLGTGANVAIFTAVQSMLLRPLPYVEPGRLVMLWNDFGPESISGNRGVVTPLQFREWRVRNTPFSDVAALESWSTNPGSRMDIVLKNFQPERWRGAFVTPNFFDLLGIEAAIGRTFSESDGYSSAEGVVVLSDGLWRRKFGADIHVIGGRLSITSGSGSTDRRPRLFTVIGVLPSRIRFTYPTDTELWALIPWSQVERETASALQYQVVGRLRPGVSLQQAQSDMNAVAVQMGRDLPESRSLSRTKINVESLDEYTLGRVRPAATLLSCVVMLVLILACSAVGNLVMGRIVGRRHEIAIRHALGASRSRLVYLLLAETVILSAAGGILGFSCVVFALPTIRSLIPSMLPRGDELTIDSSVLAFASILLPLTSLFVGLLPSLRGASFDINKNLNESSTRIGPKDVSWQRWLVTVQIAVAVSLLVGAGGLLRSFWNLSRVNLGFDGAGVLTVEMRLLDPKYLKPQRLNLFEDELMRNIRSLPNVEQASATSSVPLRGTDLMRIVRLPGTSLNEGMRANFRKVEAEYFDLLRVPVVKGRTFSPTDTAESQQVAVLSESLATLLFPNGDAIGKPITYGTMASVIGVVGDLRYVRATDQPKPALYVSRAQQPSELICLIIRTRGSLEEAAEAVRAAIWKIDPIQPVERITTLDQIVADAIADRRLYAFVTALFSVLALLLATISLYGVVSRSVTDRVREIGVRIALGATSRHIVGLVVREAVLSIVMGLSVGCMLALWIEELMRAYVFEVAAHDPRTYFAVCSAVFAVAILSCIESTSRVLRMNASPALTLR